MKMAATFSSMPPEILREIAKLLDKDGMPKFRLLTKKTWAHTLDVFAETNFAHLRHHFTEASLQDLVYITQDDIFATHIRSIEFSTARINNPRRWIGWPKSNPLHDEDIDFRRSGRQVAMLTTVLENLKRRKNHEVSLGVFDSICYHTIDKTLPQERIVPSIFGHGYQKSYGVEAVPLKADPYGTMFAISQAAKNADYSLQHLTVTTPYNSPTQTELLETDDSQVLFVKDSNRFKPDLTFTNTVIGAYENSHRLTVKVQTGAINHLSLQGRAWSRVYLIHDRAKSTKQYLKPLSRLFTGTEFQKLTFKDMQFEYSGLASMHAKIMQQTFEDLELLDVAVNLENDVGLIEPLAVTFLKHYKRRYNIKSLKISPTLP